MFKESLRRHPVPYKESTPVIREFFIENDCPYEKPWFFVDVLTAIEYAKTFPFLRLLDRLDQIRLLRRVTISCYLLHYTFVGERQDLSKLLFPDGSGLHAPPERFELAFRKVCKGVVNLATTMIKARVDVREYVLLKAIVLCNPAVSDLSPSAQKLLTEERARYGQTLFDYCMVQRGVTEGPSRFAALLNILEQLEQLAQKDKDFYVLLAASPHDDFILPYPKGHTSNRLMLEVMDV
ncbi:unnamed protein product [Caenorhabditis auriculariae]|uniref:NR LBD domain-containing protein n=1 Tax=Caenorhabditis auriculariae TaxID=2777116 RepID=A0A8S1HHF5_9PELO|nr:unnamed protein product [Caenorhabditis auriculariae]